LNFFLEFLPQWMEHGSHNPNTRRVEWSEISVYLKESFHLGLDRYVVCTPFPLHTSKTATPTSYI